MKRYSMIKIKEDYNSNIKNKIVNRIIEFKRNIINFDSLIRGILADLDIYNNRNATNILTSYLKSSLKTIKNKIDALRITSEIIDLLK